MGVDCKIVLPGNVRVQDVSRVMAAAAGFPMERVSGFPDSDAVFVATKNIRVRPFKENWGLESCLKITFDGKTIDGYENHEVMWHWEPDNELAGLRLMMPRSTAFWIAMGRRLVDFFGGWVDYQDCDDSERDYQQPFKSNAENCPSDGVDWDAFQERILATKPITVSEWRAQDKYAAYKNKITD